jgi:hypothetical protein
MDTSIRPRPTIVYPTEPDTTIAIGDRVRSFDFPGEGSCYFVGTVARIDERQGLYVIDVDYQIWEGEKAETNYCAKVCPPVNGIPGLFGPFCGVQRVLEGEEL